MPFVVSTSKNPTAVLHVVPGRFLTDGESMVLLNRLNMISLYREGGSSFEHLSDFPLFATLKFVEGLSFDDSSGNVRHLVFLFSVKQEVSVVAFSRKSDGCIEMITLFHADVNTCLYQQRINDISLCCSGVYRTLHNTTLPIVVFSIHRGSVSAFDAVAAIATHSRLSKSATQTLDNLFPCDFVQNVFKKSRRLPPFSQGNFAASEVEVRSIALVHRDGMEGCASLLVLYVDFSLKAHVSEYSIHMGSWEEKRGATKTPSRGWIPDAFNVLAAGDTFQRRCVLLSNVETNACLLHALPDGFFVLGPQLITFSSWRGAASQPGSTKSVTTLETPHSGAYAEPVCCAMLPTRELLVYFWDGRYIKVMLRDGSDGVNPGKTVLSHSAPMSLSTTPNSVAVVGERCVVGSRVDSTFWMNWRTGEGGVLVNNCGPVFDMTVAVDGPRMSVIASTGVGLSGGLNLLRSAVNVCQFAAVHGVVNVKRVCMAGNVIILSFPGYSRVCHFAVGKTMEVVEVYETPFDTLVETLELVDISQGGAFLQVTTSGVNAVQGTMQEYIHRPGHGKSVEHAHSCGGMLVFSSNTSICVLAVNEPHSVITFHSEYEVSSLAMVSTTSLLVGEWGSNAISLYDVTAEGVHPRGRFTCSATPCSVSVIPYHGTSRLLVGLLNGYVADVLLDDIAGDSSVKVAETLLTLHPVRLFNLQSHNAVLCLGEVPLVIIVSDNGFQITGIDLYGIELCGIIPSSCSPVRYIFHSKKEQSLIFGNITDVQRLNTNFFPLRATVTLVKYMAWWNVFVMSLRRNERDQILTIMGYELWAPSPLRDEQNSLELLENERCVFVESVILGGGNEWSTGTDALENSAIIIGTTFAFPDEQLSRSSRFMWCSVEQGKTANEKPQLRQQGSKDVQGALGCCCVVPNYAGRIALGINGCVALYCWNAVDSTFIAEETIGVGMILTRLMPVLQHDMSYLVAFDSRHSSSVIAVDTIQGSLSVAARDPELRGVMDGTVLHSGARDDMCFGDDFFNLFCVPHVMPSATSPDAPAAGMPTCKLPTSAQYHVGDLITAMQQGSFAPCSLSNGVVPVPKVLIPGVCGPQIVFGTTHGSFGTITPVTSETYLLLKGIEVAVAAVVPALGGFSHAAYREVLCANQERGVSRNASFEAVNPRAMEVLRERRLKYVARCVCSGDLVEMFLTLSPDTQLRVIEEAAMHIQRWCLSAGTTLEDFLERSDLDHVSHGPSQSSAPCDTETINVLLRSKSLPTLPFTVAAIATFVRNLQRAH
ncbi:putative damage-specific DNA binding protein [Trypanosoma vivax]|nr:putative damage-specific DNA binding protein [Trypanosoma vivax]